MSPVCKEPHSFLKPLLLCMPYKFLQALATLGLQLAEEEGSDFKEKLDSVKIWGDKRPGLGVNTPRKRESL